MGRRGHFRHIKFYYEALDEEIKKIEKYVKEARSGLTKEQYFEMCRMLKSTPKEDEIPISREDLSFETQEIFFIYDKLPNKWEGFSGSYLGKELLLLPTLYEEYDYDSSLRRYGWEIIPIIDSFVAEDVAAQIKSKSKNMGDKVSGK